MDITGIGSLLDFGRTIIERFVPDPAMKLKATQDMYDAQQKGELAKMAAETGLMMAQIDVNKVEAASTSRFASNWRPAVGWTCVLGIFYSFVAWPFLSWASGIWKFPEPPTLDMGTLMTLLAGMLGFGGMRMMEKLNNVASK